MLKTVSEVIDALGGTAEFARLVGASMQHVSNVKRQLDKPYFPPTWHARIMHECQSRKIEFDLSLVGLKDAQ